MINLSTEEFEKLVADGIDAIPSLYQKYMQNLAFVVEDEATPEQRQKLNLSSNQLLFGLHQGTTRAIQTSGFSGNLPDKITIFKRPHELVSHDLEDLREKVRHTIWHEVAHYYGLDHAMIYNRERRPDKDKQ
jgi:predicted Zn-dependent protease with MMP-like domain